jgi:cobyrinic acid a,c-diamide synthase
MVSGGLIIAGTHSGVGKTTISLGIMAALKKRGFRVQPFKVGPDFIDPGYHFLATGNKSRNLDSWMLSREYLFSTFCRNMEDKDIGLIEGVMGLFDGYEGKTEEGSTAQVAKWLNLPVILIVDVRSMARSAGALVYGFENYDQRLNIAGIIFNRVGSKTHFQWLKEGVEKRCKAEILGFIPKDEEIKIPERHLGLITATENPLSQDFLHILIRLVESHINLDRILHIVGFSREKENNFKEDLNSNSYLDGVTTGQSSSISPKIGVAYDEAFCFYYEDNFDILKNLGAELVFFSPLKDAKLPKNIEGIYLGGGYPEIFAEKLAANKSLKREIRGFAERGGIVYAECGGFMYLTEGIIEFEGKKHEMVGIFPTHAKMLKKLSALGYFIVEVTEDNILARRGDSIRGHQFRYSEIEKMPLKIKRTYLVRKREEGKPEEEGYLYKNVLGSYIHLHFGSNLDFARRLVENCKKLKGDQNGYGHPHCYHNPF